MNLITFIRLLMNHAKLLVITPVVVVAAVFLLTRGESRDYSTASTLYTGFASGYSINNNEGRTDFFAIKTKFDNLFANIKSRSSKEEILLKTLAFYLSKDSISDNEMLPDNRILFSDLFTKELKKELDTHVDQYEIYEQLKVRYSKDYENTIYFLINSKYSKLKDLIGFKAVEKLDAYQEGNSDRVIINFSSTDPGICYNVTRIAIEVTMENVKTIKAQESEDVVKYFLEASEVAKTKLNIAEKELSELMTRYNIINYYEQTKWLASRNEDFEVAFQNEKLNLAAAIAAEKEAEIKLNIGQGIKDKTKAVSILRKKLREVSSKIAFIEISEQNRLDSVAIFNKDSVNIKLIQLLGFKQEITDSMQVQIEGLYELNYSADGVNYKDISLRWFEGVIAVEESSAKLFQYEVFKKEFERTYTRFAKLGSQIKQMERKISVLEKDYLDLLASVNDARLLRQSVEMSSNLKVIDAPYYPVNAEKSKRFLFLIIAFLGSFMLILSLLVTMEFIDETVKTPERAATLTKLDVAGGLPVLEKDKIPEQRGLFNRLSNQLMTFVNFHYYLQESKKDPYVVIFFSTRRNEGKTEVSRLIARDLRISGEPTLVLTPKLNEGYQTILPTNDIDNLEYEMPKIFCDVEINSLISKARLKTEDYRFIFLEIPAIIGEALPIKIMRKADLSFITLKSSRVWNSADEKALKNYNKIIDHEVSVILNGTDIYALETIIGEITKERSVFRKRIKSLAKLQFGPKSY